MRKQILGAIIVSILMIGCVFSSGDNDLESGASHYLEGHYSKAEQKLRDAIGKELINHSRQKAFTILGNILCAKKEYDSSILYHKKALEIDSNYVEAWVNLGIAYRMSSQLNLAEKCYNKAIKIDPDDPEVYGSLGALYILRGETQLAIQSLERSIELNPQRAVVHSNYSVALAMAGDYVMAEDELNIAVKLGYKHGEIISRRIEELKALDE